MKQPVHLERKVIVQSLLTLLASVAVAALNGLAGSPLIDALPSWGQSLLLAGLPLVVTFLGGYVTSHTARPDLAAPTDL